MGQLIAWHYRTTLFAKLADHTYVSCGNIGKAWSCWGGKTGGTILRQGIGSTAQADAIANPDEKAGITCYLVNGVCHQAANRILFPAGITVRDARGYSVSVSLFGTYGRPRALLGLCQAPFEKHPDISGDIPECAEQQTRFSTLEKKLMSVAGDDQDESYQAYLKQVTEMYDQVYADEKSSRFTVEDTKQFQLGLFHHFVEYKLGDTRPLGSLMAIRETTEDQRIGFETLFENKELSVKQFVEQSNGLAETFQDEIANTLSEEEYQALFELERGDHVVLGDPAIAEKLYGDEV